MKTVVQKFNKKFSRWEIELPADAATSRGRGKIFKRGWCIWFLFGADTTSEYLDYYSSHRMAGDEHVRLRPNDVTESLPVISSIRVSSADPIEDARLEKEFFATNQHISEMLKAKGFGLEGDEPSSTQMHRSLSTGDLK